MFSDVVPPTSTWASVPSKAAGTVVERRCRTAETASSPAGSPDTGTESMATSPFGERTIRPGPNRGSEARVVRNCPSARSVRGSLAPLATTMSTGLAVAPGKYRCSASNPRCDSKRPGRSVGPLVPILSPKIGDAAASSSATETPAESHGRRSTERKPHPGQHVDHEDREAECVPEDGDQREGDDDRRQGDQERHEPRDDRPEHEQEYDHGRGEPELELARAKVVLGELVEVVVDRSLSGEGDVERRARIGLLHVADDVVD